MKKHFAAKHFAAEHFASGHFTGIGILVAGPYWISRAHAFMAGPTEAHAFRGGNSDDPPAHAFTAGASQLRCEPIN